MWTERVLEERALLEAEASPRIRDALVDQVGEALRKGGWEIDTTTLRKAVYREVRRTWEEAFYGSLDFWGVHAKSLRDVVGSLIEAYIRSSVEGRIDWMDRTTRRMIAEAITEALGEEPDVTRVASRLMEAWRENPEESPLSLGRALRITRTEVAAAQNAGHLAGAREAGMTHKEWVSTIDSRTRQNPPGRYPYRGFDHREPYDPETGLGTNGQVVRISHPFLVSGERLHHPGDSSMGASAGNVIQCRCTVRYLFRRT